jgi:hypothetical protein
MPDRFSGGVDYSRIVGIGVEQNRTIVTFVTTRNYGI